MDDSLIVNIFYKELFSYKAILLPDIGYVSLISNSASLSSNGRTLTPPYNTIGVYRLDEFFDSYVDLVSSISQTVMIDYNTAYSLYSDFITSHIIGNILNIPMVMTINLDEMSILRLNDRIVDALESQQLSPIIFAPKSNQSYQSRGGYHLSSTPGVLVVTLACILLLSAFLYCIYYFYLLQK